MRKVDAQGNTTVAERTLAKYLTTAQFAALTPNDGDEVYLVVDATNGVVWHLRYNAGSGSAYKWEYLGGPPLVSEVATSETTASTTYAALTTPGPSITLPFGGDYDVEVGANMGQSSTGGQVYMSYDIGATGAVDANSAWFQEISNNAQSRSVLERRKTGLTAVALTSKYRGPAHTNTFAQRNMRIRPVRIGQT